jgi:hypothetical protein
LRVLGLEDGPANLFLVSLWPPFQIIQADDIKQTIAAFGDAEQSSRKQSEERHIGMLRIEELQKVHITIKSPISLLLWRNPKVEDMTLSPSGKTEMVSGEGMRVLQAKNLTQKRVQENAANLDGYRGAILAGSIVCMRPEDDLSPVPWVTR